ncbi:hypothetical protein AB0I60_12190 [Actinosynnema sp. NPDC050436]|uniref:hypothetical protein n=1 Tax=Actinosynnema sp. NPDC050436 TaxID=3155659 RepID=UPI0033C41397
MDSPALAYHVDPLTLKEIPADEAALQRVLADPRPRTHRAWTERGLAARLLGRLDVAEQALLTALTLEPGPAAHLRLAHVWQWQGRYAEADAEYARWFDGPVADFAHQHAGKSRYDQGDWRGAQEHFRQALDAREDEDLRASSALALDAADACATAAEVAGELHRLAVPDRGPALPAVDGAVDELLSRAKSGTTATDGLVGLLRALRDHRAEAHDAARKAEGLTAQDSATDAMPSDDPVRRRVVTATDRAASVPYRALRPEDRATLLDALRGLEPADLSGKLPES